ncbi:septum site-determining protein MinC [Limnohabitans parvus]|uniref:Probable septum site-determining protein MinC n=1 Tax=Limnohabitans parvus II-B4 TaxID=1293052 RepID=A0A315EAK4_9BURK|nr:septum site-determining protein MinC [Limnohabitans parvus]PUE54311.1 septum site-determining protein MinC [Limnohabitans parvus II-B4]
MAIVSEASISNCYDIKSADLSLVALVLKTADIAAISQALVQQLKESPGFFDQDPLIIDVSFLGSEQDLPSIDFQALLPLLREHGLVPLAIKGAQGELLTQAKGVGLVDASDARIRRSVPLADVVQHVPSLEPVVAPIDAPASLGPMVIDKPLRSGQQVYAKGRDLIVLAMVNAGAEVIADGHIHIYATLRGKAIAGARGNAHARIFAQVMEPELISIAGIYRTSENALPKDVLGQAAQVCLQSGPDGDKLLISPIKS